MVWCVQPNEPRSGDGESMPLVELMLAREIDSLTTFPSYLESIKNSLLPDWVLYNDAGRRVW
jgi:hypothetical protein